MAIGIDSRMQDGFQHCFCIFVKELSLSPLSLSQGLLTAKSPHYYPETKLMHMILCSRVINMYIYFFFSCSEVYWTLSDKYLVVCGHYLQ